jgi:hypothetical protein
VLVGASAPSAASAALCADYPNQAAAQRAHDTIEADHDGIYCESLACPCLSWRRRRPEAEADVHASARRASRRVAHAHAQAHARLTAERPAARPAVHPRQQIPRLESEGVLQDRLHQAPAQCHRRHQGQRLRRIRLTVHPTGRYEIDHLIPPEPGGSNSIANLFPEALHGPPGSLDKDRLENETHARACAGRNGYRSMQRRIAED